jgi:hypothetical protein
MTKASVMKEGGNRKWAGSDNTLGKSVWQMSVEYAKDRLWNKKLAAK